MKKTIILYFFPLRSKSFRTSGEQFLARVFKTALHSTFPEDILERFFSKKGPFQNLFGISNNKIRRLAEKFRQACQR